MLKLIESQFGFTVSMQYLEEHKVPELDVSFTVNPSSFRIVWFVEEFSAWCLNSV